MTAPDFTNAPCRGRSELFFPTSTVAHRYNRQVAAAKAVCATCPLSLQEACLEVALTEHSTGGRWMEGIWASTTPEDRDELRGKRRTA